MKNKNPFAQIPHSAFDELFKHERERAETMKKVLGPSFSLHQHLKALESPLYKFSDLQKSGIYAEIERTRKMHDDYFKSFNHVMTPHWHSAVMEAAKTIGLYESGVSEQIRALSKKFDSGILAASRMLDGQNSVLEFAISATKWQDQWKSIAEQFSPSLKAFRTISEHAFARDIASIGVSELGYGAASNYLAEQAVHAQMLAEELTSSHTPEESAQLFIAFVKVLAAIFERFKDNTIDELRRLGLIGLLLTAMTIMSLPQLQPDPKISEDELRQYAQLKQEIVSLKSVLQDIVKKESSLNEEFLSSLPRAELKRRSYIRSAPKKDAPKIITAEAVTLIAVVRSQGQWIEIIFRDPLTAQLSQGWVYGTSLSILD